MGNHWLSHLFPRHDAQHKYVLGRGFDGIHNQAYDFHARISFDIHHIHKPKSLIKTRVISSHDNRALASH